MPIVQISVIEGRSAESKVHLIAEVTDAIERTIGAPKASIRVLINEIPAAHWGVAGVPKSNPP